MKKANVRELHLNTSAILKKVAQGQVYVIEKQGRPVAELRPIAPANTQRGLPDRGALLARFPKVKLDSGRILEGNVPEVLPRFGIHRQVLHQRAS